MGSSISWRSWTGTAATLSRGSSRQRWSEDFAWRRWARRSKPEIFNTDQGPQFTTDEFTGALEAAGIRVSMDGRGRVSDKIFLERLWRSVKYEEVYLHEYQKGGGCPRTLGCLFSVLQRGAAARGAGLPDAVRGLLRRAGGAEHAFRGRGLTWRALLRARRSLEWTRQAGLQLSRQCGPAPRAVHTPDKLK